jgi:hypothetical protein
MISTMEKHITYTVNLVARRENMVIASSPWASIIQISKTPISKHIFTIKGY